MNAFELDARDHYYSFPCSLCIKINQEATSCEKTCSLYNVILAESLDLKKEVEKLINSYKVKE